MTDDTKPKMQPATVAAQALGWIDEKTRGVSPLIHPSSTFIRDPDNQFRSGRAYGRADNPTYDQAEAVLASLENAKDAALFASGMAAATAVFLSLKPGDHVVVSKAMYWQLRSWLMDFATQWGLRVRLVDMTDLAAVKAAVRPGERDSSGRKRPPIPAGKSPTLPPSPKSRTPPARGLRWIRRSQRRCSRVRSISAPIS